MKIGTVTLQTPILLAPMAGVTDRTCRRICAAFGVGLSYTEMVSSRGLYYKDPKTRILLEHGPDEGLVAAQLFGNEPDVMAMAARQVEEQFSPAMIDINMGCPVRKIVQNGDGSALMKDPALAEKVASAVVGATRLPVTVKIRLGWDESSKNAVEFAKRLEGAGVAAITVHGRTREQMYMGRADWSGIAAVKQALSIPVIGNGDVVSAVSAKQLLEETGCDGIMVGRGMMGNPWLLREIDTYLKTGELLPPPDLEEKMRVLRLHAEGLLADKGPRLGVLELRKWVPWYLKGLPHSAAVREAVNRATSSEEIFLLLDQFMNKGERVE